MLRLCGRASLRAWSEKRAANAYAIGLSSGGQITTLHAFCGRLGYPVRLTLRPGSTSDVNVVELLKEHIPSFRCLVADRGYGANRFRRYPMQAGTIPVVPGRINLERRMRLDEQHHQGRGLIAVMFYDPFID